MNAAVATPGPEPDLDVPEKDELEEMAYFELGFMMGKLIAQLSAKYGVDLSRMVSWAREIASRADCQ